MTLLKQYARNVEKRFIIHILKTPYVQSATGVRRKQNKPRHTKEGQGMEPIWNKNETCCVGWSITWDEGIAIGHLLGALSLNDLKNFGLDQKEIDLIHGIREEI